MEFGLSKEQTLLQDSVARYLDRHAPLERVRRYADDNEPRAQDVWDGLCDLGIPGMLICEEHGGIGLSVLDAALVSEILGSRVAPAAFVASAVMVPLAIAWAGSKEQQSRWLEPLAAGRVLAGAAVSEAAEARHDDAVRWDGSKLHGKALFALDFNADVYLVADHNRALYLVDAAAPGLERTQLSTIDKTRRFGELIFNGAPAELLPLSSDREVCSRVLDAGRIMLAADTLGAAQTMLNRAVEYSKQRVQFGRAIGSFQAVKHMCAEMAAELEPCRAMMWYAAYAFESIPAEAQLTTCHTKAHISEVGTFVARTATEVHGGIGFTDELGLHLWFKRIGANRQLLGGPQSLREEAARIQQLA